MAGVEMVIARAGYDLNGLWRLVERSVVWHVVGRIVGNSPLGFGILFVVLLFVWKGYGTVRRYARSRTRD